MRARLAVQYPEAHAALADGDAVRAQDCMPRCVPCPAVSEADDFIAEVWAQMRSGLAGGRSLDILEWQCQARGLRSPEQRFEVWSRVNLYDAAVRYYQAGESRG
jgi:hypothetical protein